MIVHSPLSLSLIKEGKMAHRVAQLLSEDEIARRLLSVMNTDRFYKDILYPRIVEMAAGKEKCAEGLYLCVVNPIMRLRLKGGYFYDRYDLAMMMVPVWLPCLTDDEELVKEATTYWQTE